MSGADRFASLSATLRAGPGATLRRVAYGSPLYALMLGQRAETLRGTPSDPWPGDREAGAALVGGELMVGGSRIPLDADPWRQAPAGEAAVAALHGFEWLRDLRHLGTDNARHRAAALTAGWLDAFDRWAPLAWRPDVTGSRLTAWLANFGFLRAGGDVGLGDRLLRAAARQARHLVRAAEDPPADHRRFAAIKGLIHAGVSLSGQPTALKAGLALLDTECARQILPDGGHGQRCPAIHLRVLRDLIDIRAALITGHVEIPAGLQNAVDRMAPMLRAWRHGDGGLALFNDGNEEDDALVQTVLALGGSRGRAPASAPHSGFQRITAGRTIVLFDGGAPPPPWLDARAHAGLLAFEMDVGKDRLIVNCGAQVAGGDEWHDAMRRTPAHSTLCVDDADAAEIRPDGIGRRPTDVTCQRHEADGHTLVEASHDGYAVPFGLEHRRLLYIAADGSDIRGEDSLVRLGRADAGRNNARGRAFALRFHLHPDVRASMAGDGDSVLLRLPAGGGWRFRAAGGRPLLEESIYLGAPGRPRRCQQVVVRGAVGAEGAAVKWRLAREG